MQGQKQGLTQCKISALVSDKSALGDCCSLDCLAVGRGDVSEIV